jgi:hypothetical protein
MLVPHSVGAQPVNHIGEPMAEILLNNGCAMAEAELASEMEAAGWHVSDFQAQVLALFKGGYVAKAADGRLQLTGWGNCK